MRPAAPPRGAWHVELEPHSWSTGQPRGRCVANAPYNCIYYAYPEPQGFSTAAGHNAWDRAALECDLQPRPGAPGT
ncbi:MAG: hypothetical protein VB089_00450 [Anaerolineaceae bacterium]|nr:hypothetical protein [Anaerolineaceae bacterium]